MNKATGAIVAIIVIVIVAVGGYAIFHKSSKTTPSSREIFWARSHSYSNSYGSSYGSTSTPSASTSTTSSTKPVNNAILITKSSSSAGQYLASPSGMTLYTYSSDSKNTSNCTSSCLSLWPAYVDNGPTTGLPSNVGTIKRADNGQTQYTYKGMPLYFYTGDKAAGQVNGNGVAGFSVAKP